MILEPRWKSYIVATGEPVLTPQQCDELIRIGQGEPKINANIVIDNKNPKLDESYRKSIISCIPFAKALPIFQVIQQLIEITNNNYFGFDTLQLSEQSQYAEYSKGGFYNWHMDIYTEMESMPPVRKISMTLLLSDPKDFEGGELELIDSKKQPDLKRGYAVFFASFIRHRIKPITKGNRKSLVMWFGGSPLR